jgi:hypothetical protein
MPPLDSIDHARIIDEERMRFASDKITAEECVQVLNAAAKRLQALGEFDVGLLAKDSGNRGCWGGQCYSVDILMYRSTTMHYDCLVDAGYNDQGGNEALGAADATWHEVGPMDPARWRPTSDLIPAPGAGPGPGPGPSPEPEPAPFVCPQWTPITLEQAHEEARRWRTMYMNAAHNPTHLEPSITDIQLWFWRRLIELWDPADIEQEIRHPNSTTNTFCKVLPG